jgi:hypothetical protein
LETTHVYVSVYLDRLLDGEQLNVRLHLTISAFGRRFCPLQWQHVIACLTCPSSSLLCSLRGHLPLGSGALLLYQLDRLFSLAHNEL